MDILIKRILSISYRYKLSHIGSCVSALPVIQEIYREMKTGDKFILSCGHALLAQAVVMESLGLGDAEKIYLHHGTHPDRCADCGLEFSTGSLGHGIGGALGMALADTKRTIYCLISDGECDEGSVWEALRIKTKIGVPNLKVYVNMNGYSALEGVDNQILNHRLKAFCPDIKIIHTDFDGVPFLNGVSSHYYVMKPEDEKNIL